jgi:hypothetical protein
MGSREEEHIIFLELPASGQCVCPVCICMCVWPSFLCDGRWLSHTQHPTLAESLRPCHLC